MGRKKKQSAPQLSLREQTEVYLFEIINEFEVVSGIRVERVEVKHSRGIGFGAKDTIEVNIITEQ
jgi:hypothetical protein